MNIAGLIPTQVLNKIIQNNDYDFIRRRIILDIIKNREGISGNRLEYECDIDRGYFSYVVSPDDAVNSVIKQEAINKNKEKFENNGEKCPF